MALGGVQLVHYQANLLQVNYNRDTWSLCPAATMLRMLLFIVQSNRMLLHSTSWPTACWGHDSPKRQLEKTVTGGGAGFCQQQPFLLFFFEFVGGVEVALPPARSTPAARFAAEPAHLGFLTPDASALIVASVA